MSQRPIGVFDSGVGGVTVLKELVRLLEHEDFIYLGDTARVPYGTRSARTVTEYSLELLEVLLSRDVKAVVVACNTITSWALPSLKKRVEFQGIPIIGVVQPGIDSAASLAGQRVGVIATASTIHSRVYEQGLQDARSDLIVKSVACPVFVSIAEEGWTYDEIARLAAEKYLSPLRGEIDTLILGCTHFPLLRQVIQDTLPGVRIVDPAGATALQLRSALLSDGLDRSEGAGSCQYLVTDDPRKFSEVGRHLFGSILRGVELIQTAT